MWTILIMYIADGDSFESARDMDNVIIMNFANAKYVGGGFLNRAVEQEEVLCRSSTLFSSINSRRAKEVCL